MRKFKLFAFFAATLVLLASASSAEAQEVRTFRFFVLGPEGQLGGPLVPDRVIITKETDEAWDVINSPNPTSLPDGHYRQLGLVLVAGSDTVYVSDAGVDDPDFWLLPGDTSTNVSILGAYYSAAVFADGEINLLCSDEDPLKPNCNASLMVYEVTFHLD